MDVETRDPQMAEVVDPDETVHKLASGFGFTEGPAWHGPGGYLVFSDIPGDTMYRWQPGGPVTVLRAPSRMGNGNTYDAQWRLITCEHATSRVVRTEPDGSLTVLADHYGDAELNSPNDVIVDDNGTVYFTDPTFGRQEPFGVPRPEAQACRGVYRLPEGAREPTLLADDFDQPNGLCFSPDGRVLYVNDSARGHIRRFELTASGSLIGGEVFAEPVGPGEGVPDGLKTDRSGRVYCTGPGGLYVFAPSGRCLGVIHVPEVAANFTWGGPERTELFITASTSLYRIPTHTPGHVR